MIVKRDGVAAPTVVARPEGDGDPRGIGRNGPS